MMIICTTEPRLILVLVIQTLSCIPRARIKSEHESNMWHSVLPEVLVVQGETSAPEGHRVICLLALRSTASCSRSVVASVDLTRRDDHVRVAASSSRQRAMDENPPRKLPSHRGGYSERSR